MSRATTVEIGVEQAVYGSFPFWERGYAVLAQSPGCQPAWLDAFRAACQRYGERPRGVIASQGLFALPVPDGGPWMIVGVSSPGRDDRGRPGALAFHALFVEPGDYRRIGASPFPLAGAHRGDWSADTTLERLTLAVEVAPEPETAIEPRAQAIAEALGRGQRVAIEAATPIEPLARAVWQALPVRVRRQATVATWAFDNANGFDLIGQPRAVAVPDERFDADGTPAGDTTDSTARRWPDPRVLAAALAGFVLVLGLAGPRLLAMRRAADAGAGADRIRALVTLAPVRSQFGAEPVDAELNARVTAGLRDLAERFGVASPGPGATAEVAPGSLMAQIAERLRYRGPLLTADERERLERESAPGRARALAWDTHIRRFLPDRPLPADFAAGPLRWQLALLVWSFHLDDGTLDPHLAPAEVAPALAHALAVDEPVQPNPLAQRYPALTDYAAFLDALPRR